MAEEECNLYREALSVGSSLRLNHFYAIGYVEYLTIETLFWLFFWHDQHDPNCVIYR